MHALSLASGQPSAIVDWNNNYGDDPNKGVVFHCSNLPRSVFADAIPVMNYQEIFAGTVGKDSTWGHDLRARQAGAVHYLRLCSDDLNGSHTSYVGEGRFTDDPLETSAATVWSRFRTTRRCSRTLRERLRASRLD